LGLDQVLEREGLDRARLTLPPAQAALLQAVSAAAAAGGPLVVVLVGGGAIAEAAPAAQALVASFYPGELGGEALAQLLLGEAPFSGRLPVTVYTADYAFRRAPTDMQLAPHGATPGATYLYAERNDTLFAFGAGLSATPLGLGLASAAEITIDAGAWASGAVPAPAWTVSVTSGAAAGSAAAVVLAFFELGLGSTEPSAKLFDFARTDDLASSAQALLNLTLPSAVAAIVDANGTRTLTPGRYRVRLGGDAAGDAAGMEAAPIIGFINVTGKPVVIDELPW
jgi:beta-glucosidase